jgi:NAD+ kinase
MHKAKNTGEKPIAFKKKIRKVAIVCRRNSTNAIALGREVAEWLSEHKIMVYSRPGQVISAKVKALKSLDDLDLVCVLGGDGTYLEAVRLLQGHRVPILGVNMGSLGFLTVMRSQDVYQMLELAIGGELELKTRSMIRITLRRAGKIRDEFAALNDLVIERGAHSQLIHISMVVDKLPITTLKADGLILATPTGSTAYNLAAGGPILHPEVGALVATPICPLSLTSRQFIFPDNRKIQLSLLGSGARGMLTVDGQKKATLDTNDEVCVERHVCDHLFLRKMGHNYFSLLKEKLKFGERA